MNTLFIHIFLFFGFFCFFFLDSWLDAWGCCVFKMLLVHYFLLLLDTKCSISLLPVNILFPFGINGMSLSGRQLLLLALPHYLSIAEPLIQGKFHTSRSQKASTPGPLLQKPFVVWRKHDILIFRYIRAFFILRLFWDFCYCHTTSVWKEFTSIYLFTKYANYMNINLLQSI